MILVTGAAGKTGRAIVHSLVERGEVVRGLVHRSEQVGTLRELGAAEVLQGDMYSQQTFEKAMHGARAVYHICPNMHPEEIIIGSSAIQTARRVGIEHFVYHSVLHPQTESMPHHWKKLQVEELLLESGLNFTILQPAVYMQNVLGYWKHILQEHVYPVPYLPSTRLGMVDLVDVAETAARILCESGHVGATYELVGIPPLSQDQLAEILSQELGFEVLALATPLPVWEAQVRAAGMDDYQVGTLMKMFEYYEKFGLWGSPNVLKWLLGREPIDFAGFIRRNLKNSTAV
jgi:uncharacterized protein YbjT (DUF2867 family)